MSERSIKPLDWHEKDDYSGSTITGDRGGAHMTAKTICGMYAIHSFDGNETFVVFMPGEFKRNAASVMAARQIAQWDFEARIMSAFVEEPRP